MTINFINLLYLQEYSVFVYYDYSDLYERNYMIYNVGFGLEIETKSISIYSCG